MKLVSGEKLWEDFSFFEKLYASWAMRTVYPKPSIFKFVRDNTSLKMWRWRWETAHTVAVLEYEGEREYASVQPH